MCLSDMTIRSKKMLMDAKIKKMTKTIWSFKKNMGANQN